MFDIRGDWQTSNINSQQASLLLAEVDSLIAEKRQEIADLPSSIGNPTPQLNAVNTAHQSTNHKILVA